MGGSIPPSVTPPIQDIVPVNLKDDDEAAVYECYLCYREFESAKKLASHTTKPSHIELMRKDFYYKEIWRFQPYPPDQGPGDFALCTRQVGVVSTSSYHSYIPILGQSCALVRSNVGALIQ